ncbi:MAG: 1,4-alpha-glucan branching protein GlgB, partial [Gemmatimonadetes bacterium]|nr:1,4-alpha-glucan branching protein GlgB [Gemmatimonadota bacterium]
PSRGSESSPEGLAFRLTFGILRLPTLRGATHGRKVGDNGPKRRSEWVSMGKLGVPLGRRQLLDAADLLSFRKGEHVRIHEFLGAHLRVVDGVEGACFAVWAPHARRVHLAGDFNRWEGRRHPMHRREEAGVWELFVPGVAEGARYRYEILTARRDPVEKCDPVGFAMESWSGSTSVVVDLRRHVWGDAAWMERRAEDQVPSAPMSIYEVHLGSWRRRGDPGGWLSYRELAATLLPYAKDLGFTHLEMLPVTEHPFDGSWGYQPIGYFAPTSRFGAPDDFRHFVDAAHQMGLGVILDWVPAHFPRDLHGLALFDGTHLYEHADPRRGEHPDWETAIFDYGRPEVASFLTSSALFWLEEYHVDGLRVDAVASMLYLDYSRAPGEWVPNIRGGRENLEAVDFLQRLNDTLHAEHPGALRIAEESTVWPGVSRPAGEGGLGFDLKWNMGWMNDTLRFFQLPFAERAAHHETITFSIMYAFGERYVLPLSHDEVVHLKRSLLGKMPGVEAERFAGLRSLYGYMWAHPGRKLLFMGGEIGALREWDHDGELDWTLPTLPLHHGLQRLVRDLNELYGVEPALHERDDSADGFEWLDVHDSRGSVLSFVRRASDPGELVVVVANLSARDQPAYELQLPTGGRYRVLLNTDSRRYGGRGRVAANDIQAVEVEGRGADAPCRAEV